jgi:hypothetical protein
MGRSATLKEIYSSGKVESFCDDGSDCDTGFAYPRTRKSRTTRPTFPRKCWSKLSVFSPRKRSWYSTPFLPHLSIDSDAVRRVPITGVIHRILQDPGRKATTVTTLRVPFLTTMGRIVDLCASVPRGFRSRPDAFFLPVLDILPDLLVELHAVAVQMGKDYSADIAALPILVST